MRIANSFHFQALKLSTNWLPVLLVPKLNGLAIFVAANELLSFIFGPPSRLPFGRIKSLLTINLSGLWFTASEVGCVPNSKESMSDSSHSSLSFFLGFKRVES